MRGLWFVNECITVSSFLFFVFCFIKKVRGPLRSVRQSDSRNPYRIGKCRLLNFQKSRFVEANLILMRPSRPPLTWKAHTAHCFNKGTRFSAKDKRQKKQNKTKQNKSKHAYL